jgi:hypothetical protein
MLSTKSKEDLKKRSKKLNLAGVTASNSLATKEHIFFSLNATVNERKHVWFTTTDLKSNVVALIRKR